MIRNKRKLDESYRKLDAEENLSCGEALPTYDAFHKEAVELGTIGHENIWDGFEAVFRIGRALNGL